MKIFVFEQIENVSNNYHSEGGLVIIADDIDDAKKIIKSDNAISITDEEWSDVKSFDLKNKEMRQVFVMPNAGCC